MIKFNLLFVIAIYAFSQKVDFISPSPTAYSYMKHGEIPVNMSRGVVSLTVPITAIAHGDMSVGVSLSYHSAGFTVNEQSGLVGLGWSLNTAGIITRVIRDKPDEHDYEDDAIAQGAHNYVHGYRYYGNEMQNFDFENKDGWVNFVADRAYPPERNYTTPQSYDFKPDDYYFNIEGQSGKLVVLPIQPGEDSPEIYTVPYRPWKIKWICEKNDIESTDENKNYWEITTNNGSVYTFGQKEYTKSMQYNTVKNGFENPYGSIVKDMDIRWDVKRKYASSWYLTKKKTANKNVINYKYSVNPKKTVERNKLAYLYKELAYSEKLINPQGLVSSYSTHIPASETISNLIKETNEVALKEITFGESRIEFQNSISTRSPLLKDNGFIKAKNKSGHYRLNAIKTFTNNQLINHYSFIYDENQPLSFLRSVNRKYTGDSSRDETTTFQYYGLDKGIKISLPGELTYKTDYYGYLNGANNSNLTVPYQKIFTGYQKPNREPNIAYTKAGVLSKIIYPSGAFQEFEYEANKISENYSQDGNLLPKRTVGGVRVRSILRDDLVGNQTKIVYEYNDNSGKSSAKAPSDLEISTSANYTRTANYTNGAKAELYVNKDRTDHGIAEPQLSAAIYEKVTKRTYLNNDYQFKTEYLFTGNGNLKHQNLKPKSIGFAGLRFNTNLMYSDRSFLRELPISTINYDKSGSIVSETKTSYNLDENPYYVQKAIDFKETRRWNFQIFGQQVFPTVQNQADLYLSYVPKIYPVQTVSKIDGITKKETFTYDTKRRPKTKTTWNSNNDEYKSVFIYPDEVSHSFRSQFHYDKLINKNIIGSPIQTEAWVNGKIKSANRLSFDSNNRLKRVYVLKETVGSSPSFANNNAFLYTHSYTYSNEGMLTKIHNSYSQQIGEATYFKKFYISSLKTSNATSRYSYNENRSVNNIKKENSKPTYFEFDAFNRLLKTTYNGKPLNSNEYQLGGVSGGVTKNYVKSYVYYNDWSIGESKTFLDGLGNPIQTQIKVNPSKYIINSKVLDGLGRESKLFKPAIINSGFNFVEISNPSFIANLKSLYPDHNNYPYTANKFQPSGLGRLDYILNPGQNHTSPKYKASISYGKANGYESKFLSGDYNHEYSRVIKTDENGVQTAIFTDKLGRNVMTIKAYREYFFSDNSHNIVTRNIYDDLGNLIQIDHPNAISINKEGKFSYVGNGDRSTYYKYNNLAQLIRKETPYSNAPIQVSSKPEHNINYNPDFEYVFDKLGRLRFSIDPNSRANGKMYYKKYDQFNRVTHEGEYDISGATQANADNTAYPNTSTWNINYVYDVPHLAYKNRNVQGLLSYTNEKDTDGKIVHRVYSYNDDGQKEWSYFTTAYYNTKVYYTAYGRQNQLLSSYVKIGDDVQYYRWFDYNNQGQVTSVYQSKSNIKPSTSLVTYEYNINGTIKSKNIANSLQKIDYKYNIRNWLTSINGDREAHDQFSMKLNYWNNLPNTVKANYNGNISSIELNYSNNSSIEPLKTGYVYDKLNRLRASNTFDLSNKKLSIYNTAYSYDKIGNILKLMRTGKTPGSNGSGSNQN